MKQLKPGQFYGDTQITTQLPGLTMTETEYTLDHVDWHHHERPYFTFLLQGNLLEGTKKAIHHCAPGALLFHNWQEPHYNIKPRGISRGFHIELEYYWLRAFDQNIESVQGDLRILDPDIKILFHQIFRESKQIGDEQSIAVQTLLLQVLSLMQNIHGQHIAGIPMWVKRIHDYLHDMRTETPSLAELSKIAGVHPVHLSREFPRYFRCSMGPYLRKLKVEHALSLMTNASNTLTAIAHSSGFADQSHFIRCFREVMGVSPSVYRKLS